MAKRKPDNNRSGQLSLEDLIARLETEPGKFVKLPIEPDDIGGELLAVLSKGLYTDPMDCIREYVQNAVDAHAQSVTIKITGNSVTIFDDGNGMLLEELVQARQFGLSRKSLHENVGFRGIGIYSGFDLCQRLRISTKKADDAHQHVMVFDFAAMRTQLDQDKRPGSTNKKTPLIELLSEHTRVSREITTIDRKRSYTTVDLQDISDVHIRQLSNRARLREYLLQNLPIDFADDFEYRAEIKQHLQDHIPGYHAIKITLQSDGVKDEVVARAAISGLRDPYFGHIETTSGLRVAYYWACLNSERSRLQPRPATEKGKALEERTSYEGFVYKVKGFSIGDRQKLLPMFKRKPQLYPWYTGEIYVVDTNVIPNAERDDFETNNAKRALEMAVGITLASLETDAETFQARGVADERIDNYERDLNSIASQVEGNTNENDFDTYSRLDEILRDVKRQRLKCTPERKHEADDIIKRSQALQRRLRKEVDAPSTEASRRKQAAKNKTVVERTAVPTVQSPPPSAQKTLTGILVDIGWPIDGDTARLVEIIQASLEDVISVGSVAYRGVLNNIEARLAASNGEE